MELQLEQHASSAGAARRVLRTELPPMPIADELLLLVSEIVTNAVLHGGEPIRLLVDLSQEVVHVEVSDGGDSLPRQREPDPHAVSGRGLQIVDQMAASWGVRPHDGGKSVWFDLAVR